MTGRGFPTKAFAASSAFDSKVPCTILGDFLLSFNPEGVFARDRRPAEFGAELTADLSSSTLGENALDDIYDFLEFPSPL